MVSRREALHETLRLWRTAERELFESGDGNDVLQANVARLRADYQRGYTDNMIDNMARLREADADLRISNIRDRVPYQRTEDIAKLVEGLRKAGLA